MYCLPDVTALDLRALFNSSPNAYVLLNRQLQIVGMNQAYLQATLRTAESLLGRGIFDAFPSDPASVPGRLLRQSLARVLDQRQADHLSCIHYPIARADGTLEDRHWSATHIPLHGNPPSADGAPAFILQHTVDVTELTRLRAQSGVQPQQATAMATGVLHRANALQAVNLALGEERAFLRQLFEQAPGFVAVLRGPQHVVELVNAAYRQLVGQRALINLPLRQALPELADQGFLALLDAAYHSGAPYIGRSMPARLQRAPGAPLEQRQLDFVFQPLQDQDGQVSAIFVQGHDITEQYQAQRAAQESESRFRSLAHSLPSHVWTALPDGLLDWCNDQTCQYCGLPATALLGTGWARTVHPDDIDRASSIWQQALASGLPYQTEFRLRRHDGVYRWHTTRAHPLRDAGGTVVRWIGTNSDIEDQKAAAALLADLNNHLTQRVDERSAELLRMQEVLRHSQKMEAIGNLAGGIAHDFNNLLQVISGNLQLLLHEVAGQPAAEQRVAKAQAGVQRGAKLAAQLLAFGRRQALAPEVVNAGRLVRGMDDMLRSTLGEGIEIDTVIAADLWNTLADPGNVENALLNLAINARDAMGGQGRLTISAGNTSLDAGPAGGHDAGHDAVLAGQYVLLSVSDTGCGMPPEVVERAFEPFFSTKPEGKGTGLGLAMVYGFVKQSGGHVKVRSTAGQGTTIEIYLPRCTSAEASPAEAEAESVQLEPGSETILVAEDDDAVRETTVALLTEMGYRVLKARDAQSALSIIDSGLVVDLLFIDVVMPGPLNGTDLAHRAQASQPGLAVLFTSGYAEHTTTHDGRLAPGVQLLGKPYSREALGRRVRQALRLATRASPRSAQRAPPRPAATPGARPAAPTAPLAAPLRVLLCEDDALVRQTVAEVLRAMDCEVLEADSAATARNALLDNAQDLLITDLGLPDDDGLHLARWARAHQPGLLVAIASGQASEQAAALLPGAIALPKPFDADSLAQLLARLRG